MRVSNETLEKDIQAVESLQLLQTHEYITPQTRMRILDMLFPNRDKKSGRSSFTVNGDE